MSSFRHEKIAGFLRGILLPGKGSLTFDRLAFPMKHLSRRKRWNCVLQEARRIANPANGFGMPPILQIEPVNFCNLRCPACAFGAGLIRRPPAALSFDLYRSIIDQVKDHTCLMAFWAWGEPFLHEGACDMIRYARDNGILVHTSTNGHFFRTRKEARRVIESGLDSVIVCVDGLDQKTYETYRVGGELGIVLESVRNLVEERNFLGRENPRITLRFLVMRHNEHQAREFERKALELGADAASLRFPIVRRQDVDLEGRLDPLHEAYGTPTTPRGRTGRRGISLPAAHCGRPYGNLTIFSSGEVVLCENDENASFSLGNASRHGIRDILASRHARNLLASFRRRAGKLPFCADCEANRHRGDSLNLQTRAFQKESRR